MESLYSEKDKNISKLIIENFLKPARFVKGFFSWHFFQRETLEVKLKQKNTQIKDLKDQLNIVDHMYEEGRNLLKEQKRGLEEMLKMEREGANIPSLIQLGSEKTKMSQWSKVKINKLKAKIERLTKAGIHTTPEGHYELGLIAYYHDKADDAILEYKKVIEFNPGLPDVHYNLGVVYGEKGMLMQAKREVSIYKNWIAANKQPDFSMLNQ